MVGFGDCRLTVRRTEVGRTCLPRRTPAGEGNLGNHSGCPPSLALQYLLWNTHLLGLVDEPLLCLAKIVNRPDSSYIILLFLIEPIQ